MSTIGKSPFLWTARFLAVGFALTTAGYLVVNAQRRAQPADEPGTRTSTPNETPNAAVATPAGTPESLSQAAAGSAGEPVITTTVDAGAGAANGTLLHSSKVLILDDSVKSVDPTLLFGSKSGVIETEIADDGSVGIQTPPLPPATPPPVLLPTSKSGPPVLMSSSKRLDAPVLQPKHAPIPGGPNTAPPASAPTDPAKAPQAGPAPKRGG